MLGMITAIISGLLMSVQGVFNTQVTKQSGPWVTNAFVEITGFAVCLAIWMFKERGTAGFADVWSASPKYLLTGGIIGAFITFTVISSMGKLGPATAVMLIVSSQVVSAYLIELFGWFGVERMDFQWIKLLGVALFFAGILVFKKA